MRLFRRKQKNTTPDDDKTSDTFVEATGGGWTDSPDVVADDGGSRADYVGQQLKLAKAQAQSVPIGESFQYRLRDIPRITHPYEIMFGLMMRAPDYGLQCGVIVNEEVTFTRRK